MKNLLLFFALFFIVLMSSLNAGDDWNKKSPTLMPTARYLTSMAYISGSQQLLFGGYADGGDYYNDDTWLYNYLTDQWNDEDPGTWTSGIDKPIGRHYSVLAYLGDDKVLLFGGYDGSSNLDDTWVYDLSDNTWTNKDPGTWISGVDKPPALRAHDMAWIGNDKALLFGGIELANSNETWVYDLSDNTWTNKDPGTWISGTDKPSERSSHSCSYFGGDKIILFGGSIGSALSNETWVYDLSDNAWTKLTPTSNPTVRYLQNMVYMGDDKALIFGGYDRDLVIKYNDTWVFDYSDNAWTQDFNSTQPTVRYGHTMAESSMDGSSYVVLFGGLIDDPVPGAMSNETWTFGGGDYPLPVELTSFAVELISSSVQLSWETATEVNNYGFEVQRTYDLLEWDKIGFVIGHGNSNSPKYYSFTDESVSKSGKYYYRLKQIDIDGQFEYSNVVKIDLSTPMNYILNQNYPNPFNPSTTIQYSIPKKSNVTLKVFDALGSEVVTLINTEQPQGNYEVKFDVSDPTSGIYFYRLRTGEFEETKKMILLK